MASSPARERISAFALTAAMSGLVTSLGAGAVFASQGPGGGLGTASGYPTGHGDHCLWDVSAAGRHGADRCGTPAAPGSQIGFC
jgi:hypothetical protein